MSGAWVYFSVSILGCVYVGFSAHDVGVYVAGCLLAANTTVGALTLIRDYTMGEKV